MGKSNIREFPSGDPATESASSGVDDGGTLARLARLEALMQHTATKADIESVKTLIAEKHNSMLKWLIAILISSIGAVAVALIKTFLD